MAERRRKRVEATQRLPLAQAQKEYLIEPTKRELELITLLATGGVRGLTTDQIERQSFPGNRTSCNDRLLRLFQNRYLWRFKVNLRELGITDGPRRTLMHTIDQEGVIVAAHQLGVLADSIPWRPTDRTIETQELKHIILNNDIRISLKLATSELQKQWQADNPDATKGYEITRWETDQTIRRKPDAHRFIVDYVPPYENSQTPESGEIVPDDLLILLTPTFNFISLIELDTHSEVRTPTTRPKGKDTSVASKIRKYLSLFHKPSKKEPSKFEEATGIENQRGVRAFFITTGGQRAVENLLSAIRDAGGRNMFWVGRYELARSERLVLTRPIWRKAGSDNEEYYPWIGRSRIEEIRLRLTKYGVAAEEIEARVAMITNLAKTQMLNEWSERKKHNKGMSLSQAEVLRCDELAQAVLERFEERVGKEMGEAEGA